VGQLKNSRYTVRLDFLPLEFLLLCRIGQDVRAGFGFLISELKKKIKKNYGVVATRITLPIQSSTIY
jgi:hypothetical protein